MAPYELYSSMGKVPPNLHAVSVPQRTAPHSAGRASLLSLPPELLFMVTKHLDKSCSPDPLANLARTCRGLFHVIQQSLFRNLRTGSAGKEWSTRSVYNLLRTIEENPHLRKYVESIVFLGNEGRDTVESSHWDVANTAQNERLFKTLLDRYLERGWRLDGESRAARECPLQLTLLPCLIQKTLSRAHIKVPQEFWIPNQVEERRKLAYRTGFTLDAYNGYDIPNGIMLKEIPTFQRLVDLTLEGTGGVLNTETAGMMLAAMPNLARLTFRSCLTIDRSPAVPITIPEHVSSLTLDRCPKLRKLYIHLPNPIILHDRLRNFFIGERLRDLRGVYANDSGLEIGVYPNRTELVQVVPDEDMSITVQNGAPPFGSPYTQGANPDNEGIARVLTFLVPAALSLERIYLGHCRPQTQTPTSFRNFPNLKKVSIHCSNFPPNIGSNMLIDIFINCRSLEAVELVGVDHARHILRPLLALAKAVGGEEIGRFPRLRKVILTCHNLDGARALNVHPFASKFAERMVELVLMARGGWEGGKRAMSGGKGKTRV